MLLVRLAERGRQRGGPPDGRLDPEQLLGDLRLALRLRVDPGSPLLGLPGRRSLGRMDVDLLSPAGEGDVLAQLSHRTRTVRCRYYLEQEASVSRYRPDARGGSATRPARRAPAPLEVIPFEPPQRRVRRGELPGQLRAHASGTRSPTGRATPCTSTSRTGRGSTSSRSPTSRPELGADGGRGNLFALDLARPVTGDRRGPSGLPLRGAEEGGVHGLRAQRGRPEGGHALPHARDTRILHRRPADPGP